MMGIGVIYSGKIKFEGSLEPNYDHFSSHDFILVNGEHNLTRELHWHPVFDDVHVLNLSWKKDKKSL